MKSTNNKFIAVRREEKKVGTYCGVTSEASEARTWLCWDIVAVVIDEDLICGAPAGIEREKKCALRAGSPEFYSRSEHICFRSECIYLFTAIYNFDLYYVLYQTPLFYVKQKTSSQVLEITFIE